MSNSEFLNYLLQYTESDDERLPAINDLSGELGISKSTLREQLEVARALGLVDVRPRLGIRLRPYSFTPAVDASLCYAIEYDRGYFEDFVDLRRHLELAYFPQAIDLLRQEDIEELRSLVASAWNKLEGKPTRIPHLEHRQLHLAFYKRLNNIFVTGLLEAYWDAYEAVGLNVYTDLEYLEQVWKYHQELVEVAAARDKDRAERILKEHFELMDRMVM
ncbi:MAG: FadR/GntR family transcriptional regulator [Anaerolineales bacterium]|jgi:DNA-binding FadR family transcriptional regulator